MMDSRKELCVIAFACLAGSSVALSAEATPHQPDMKAMGVSGQDFSFGYWLNGYRKHASDRSEDILCFETGHFGLTLDLNNLREATFGRFNDKTVYADGLEAGAGRMQQLDPAELVIEVSRGSNVFRATRCDLGKPDNGKRLDRARLWESGRLVQHYDLQKLVLEDAAGARLECKGTLDVVAWPESLTMTLELVPRPELPPIRGKGKIQITLRTSDGEWTAEKVISEDWTKDERRVLTLTCDFKGKPIEKDAVSVQCRLPKGQAFPVSYTTDMGCYVANIGRIERDWRGGYTDIRHYDEFSLVVENSGDESVSVPFLLDLRSAANITGLCPMLCDENGVPTGIPVQLSKNWHYWPMGEYLRAYALVPAQPGTSTYTLRIAYGFYGTLPSASHAQLSLVGYGGHGRWEQLAIGCWGETMCLDLDMSLVDVAITDVRMLMARAGLNGRKWGWTNAGWGGDWLHARDEQEKKHYFSEMKTAYLSHGPCLTEVQYDGKYGSEREVDVKATVRTTRSDDYARTFQQLRYVFDATNSFEKGWLFKMGATGGPLTPRIAYGHRDGLIADQEVPRNLKRKDLFMDSVALSGEGPWWVTFPGAEFAGQRRSGSGTRALVIRSYRATFGETTYTTPTISMPVGWVHQDGRSCIDLLLVPPPGVTEFHPGDQVEMDLEWITIPRIADDYYGPNEALRQHLAEHPRSWKTVHREAAGNDLKVNVTGGTLVQNYPIIIGTTQPEVKVDIEGGVGMVPIRFEGLPSPTGLTLYQQTGEQLTALDQSVHGNDFWQAELDERSDTYKLTYNLPLDGLKTSTWVLKR